VTAFVAAPIGGRLYLPQSWLEDAKRCAKAGVPPDVDFATKSEIALTLIEQALADQVLPAPVLGDSAYGDGFAFRARLRELKMELFLQVTPEEHRDWIEEVPTTSKANTAQWTKRPPRVHAISLKSRALCLQRLERIRSCLHGLIAEHLDVSPVTIQGSAVQAGELKTKGEQNMKTKLIIYALAALTLINGTQAQSRKGNALGNKAPNPNNSATRGYFLTVFAVPLLPRPQ
jgi:DDE superfamily endonuclease